MGQNITAISPNFSLLNRSKRLVVAIYKVLAYLDNDDAICPVLKTRVLDVMDSALALKDIREPLNRLLPYMDVLLYLDFLSETNIGILKDEILSFLTQAEREYALQQSSLDLTIILPDSVTVEQPSISSASVYQGRQSQKEKRQKIILDFIRKHQGARVRELAATVKGCSEKTIQRELTALITKGQVRREGQKRWSKYFLAGPSSLLTAQTSHAILSG